MKTPMNLEAGRNEPCEIFNPIIIFTISKSSS